MITEQEYEILKHALGINERNPNGYRNYFCADRGASDHVVCLSLTNRGLMRCTGIFPDTNFEYFHVTDEGKQLMNDYEEKRKYSLTKTEGLFPKYDLLEVLKKQYQSDMGVQAALLYKKEARRLAEIIKESLESITYKVDAEGNYFYECDEYYANKLHSLAQQLRETGIDECEK